MKLGGEWWGRGSRGGRCGCLGEVGGGRRVYGFMGARERRDLREWGRLVDWWAGGLVEQKDGEWGKESEGRFYS